MVILAVKPHIIPIALEDLKKAQDVKADKLFISVAMGVTTKQLQQVSFCFNQSQAFHNTNYTLIVVQKGLCMLVRYV